MLSDILYSIDSEGRFRTWQYELDKDNGRFRTITGLLDGKKTISGWTTCPPKSQMTKHLQAVFEANSAFAKKVKNGWFLTKEGANNSDYVKPVLCQPYKEWTVPCMGQAKLDGVRMLMYRNGLWTRTGEPIIAVPHIMEQLADLIEYDPSFMLDGELYNHELHDDLDRISGHSRLKLLTPDILRETSALQYHVYDCPSHLGGYEARHEALSEAINAIGADCIQIVPYVHLKTENDFIDYMVENLENRYEGTILRSYEGTAYEFGKRNKHVRKVKEFTTEEFPLVDIEEGNGNWAGRAKRGIILMPSGKLCETGLRADFATAEKLLKEKHLYIGGEVTVRFFRYTKDGLLNLPVIIDFNRHGR